MRSMMRMNNAKEEETSFSPVLGSIVSGQYLVLHRDEVTCFHRGPHR